MKFNLNRPDLFSEQLKEYCIEFLKSFLKQDYTYKVSSEVFQERFDLCKSCDHFNGESIKCVECGCSLLTKMVDSLESCPIEKWSVDMDGLMKKHYSEIVSSMPQDYASFEIVVNDD